MSNFRHTPIKKAPTHVSGLKTTKGKANEVAFA
jgi:hypothetical protein